MSLAEAAMELEEDRLMEEALAKMQAQKVKYTTTELT